MDRNAIEKCKSRLRNAQKAVEDLRAYLEIEDLQSFEDTWFTFLFSWKSIYTTLEQGSKTTPQSRGVEIHGILIIIYLQRIS